MHLLNIRATGQPDFQVQLTQGQSLFVLGANGTGKSRLMHHFFKQHPSALRITGHRQVFLQSEEITLNQSKASAEDNQRKAEVQESAVWKEDNSWLKNMLTMTRFIDAINQCNSEQIEAYEAHDETRIEGLKENSPLKKLNQIFMGAGFGIRFSLNNGSDLQARKDSSQPYPVARLSDGERNALFLACDILIAAPQKLIFLDEPEKHLHRKLVTPLIAEILLSRTDCTFVVSTHDIELTTHFEESKILMLRGCQHISVNDAVWEVDLLDSTHNISEQTKLDILGSRRKIIYVEGGENSLDKPLFQILFPENTIIAKEGYNGVKTAVSTMQSMESINWIKARGIIDNDGRTAQEIAELMSIGVYAIPIYSIESFYYHPDIIEMIAKRQSQVIGVSAEELCTKVTAQIVGSVKPHVDRLAAHVSVRKVGWMVENKRPDLSTVQTLAPVNIVVDVASIVSKSKDTLQKAIDENDIKTIVCRFPIKMTPTISGIVSALEFKNPKSYQRAIRKMITEDPVALSTARSLFNGLWEEIDS